MAGFFQFPVLERLGHVSVLRSFVLYGVHILFIRSLIDGYLGCIHVLFIMSNVTMNICVQGFAWSHISIFS